MTSSSFLRFGSAVLSGAIAAVYFLIAAGAITVVSTADQSGGWVIPGAAGAAFTVLALFLVATKRRLVDAIGIGLAALTIVGYFVVAPNRTPQFEAWGISIKILQTALLLALGYLFFARSRSLKQVT